MGICDRHEVFVNDDGIVPTCDLCDGPQRVEGDDWNGDTGNHVSCEERDASRPSASLSEAKERAQARWARG